MLSDLMVFTTPKFQRADMLLALLQLALKKAGLHTEARRLEGLDLTSRSMARAALEILNAMNVPAREAQEVHHLAVQAVEEALTSPLLVHVTN